MKSTHDIAARGPIARVLAFTFAFGLAACSEAEKPGETESPAEEPNISLSIGKDGNLVITDEKGQAVGTPCSMNPKAEDACSLVKEGHEIQMKRITTVTVYQHTGTQCRTYDFFDRTTGTLKAYQVCW